MIFSKSLYAAVVGAMLLTVSSMEAAPQRLLNHVPRAVNEAVQAGPVAAATPVNLAIGLPLRNRAALDQLVQQVADPASPNYRHYLSASDFADQFGPTQQDYDKLAAYFTANGFTVSGKHANRMVLDVSGTVGAANKALNISLTNWNHATRGRFYAPDRDPSLEAGVTITDISGLDNFVVAKPMNLKSMALNAAAPLVTGSGPSGLFIGKDFRAAYAPNVTMTGAGQAIGLVEFDGFFPADLTANFKQAGLPVPTVSTVTVDGFSGPPGGDNVEVILDIAMAGYMAPGAKIIVYEGYYPNDVLNRMATDNTAKQLSCSWGYGINSTTEQIFLQMIAQGQSFFTASGDSGAYSSGIMPPADDPNVTSVGGTALSTSATGGAWQSESAWSGSGGGVSTTYPIPSYQKGMNMAAQGGSNTMRNMPDVALTGAVQIFLIYSNGHSSAIGGTSAATPLWAGFTALANQQAAANLAPPLGFMNPTLYAIGNKASTYAASLHDITTGNTGFAAITGYDLTTGWGSPNGQALINNLLSIQSAPGFTLSATPNAVSVQAGASVTSSIQVNVQNGFSSAVALSLAGLPSGVTGTFGTSSTGRASVLTLAAASTAVPGTYSVAVQGVSGTLSSSVQLSLTVTGTPNFSVTTSTPTLNLMQGGTSSSSVSAVPVNGFSGTVSFTVSGLPSGVTASLTAANSASSSTLGFAATSSAVTGTTTVTITGTSGGLSHTATIALTVIPPASFSVGTSTPTLSVLQAATASSMITVTPKNGFTGKVVLTTSSLPSGVTASFSAPSTSSTSLVTFIATPTAAAGTATISVIGTSGTASATATIILTVKPGPSFTLAASPASLNVTQGASGTSSIGVTPVNGFTGTPTLSITGLPAGVTAAFTGNTLKLTVNGTAAPGSSSVTITGTSGSVSAQTSVALTVVAASGFKLTSVSNVNVVPGSTGTAVVAVTPQGGFSGTVALSVTGLPAGVTASFSPVSTTTTSTLTLTAASGAAAKVTQLTVVGTAGTLTSSASMTVTVTPPPDFAITLAPSSLNVIKGGKGTTAITLTPTNGFAGAVALSASGLPAGVTASFTTANSGILALLTVSNTAAAGTSQVNLIAASGPLSHTAVLSLTVTAPTPSTATVDLSASYNVAGIAVDRLPFTGGGLDGGGRSYSGMIFGASQLIVGTEYSFGPMGLPDAVTSQTVALPAGQFKTLQMLATGLNGNETAQKFIVTYTDGTTTTFTQSVSDWFTPQNYAGEVKAMILPYRDNSTGTTDGEPFYLYGYSFSLNNTKTVKSVTLPQNRNVVVLAMTLSGGTAASTKANVTTLERRR